MSQTTYGGKRLIPVQSVNVAKQYATTPDGTKVGSLFNLAVNGTLLSYMGSPSSSGTFWTISGYPSNEPTIQSTESQRLAAILRKQEAMRDLFSDDGLSFEVQSADGSTALRCNPRVKGITFHDGVWHTLCNYTVDLEADIVYGASFIAPSGEDSFAQFLQEASEDWNLDLNDAPEFVGQNTLTFQSNQTYRLTHNIAAVGKRFYNDVSGLVKPAWQWAKEWVQPRMGLDTDRVQAVGALNLPAYYSGFNHLRAETVDELAGRYAITESWILSSGSAIEDFTVTTRRDSQSAVVNVNVEGRITGFEVRNADYGVVTNKYDSAVSKFNQVSGLALTRAQALTGLTLNIVPRSQVIQRFHNQGSIAYTFEYDDRPSNYISGAIAEQISIVDNLSADVFAAIPVLGRAAGPVLQDLDTITPPTRTLNINCIMNKQTISSLQTAFNNNPRINAASAASVQAIITAADPTTNGYSGVYVSEKSENWDPFNATYSFQMTWLYQ
jgi:hypothetical protein